MGRKEHLFKINMSFNDLLKKTVHDADAKVTSKKNKDVITTKKDGKEKTIEILKNNEG